MKVAARCWLVLLLAASLGFAQKVNTEFDESTDFSTYKTFAWRQGRITSRHPALDNTLVEKKVRNLIEARLTAKGLREVELTDNPDLVVSYVLGAANRREVDTVPAGWRGLRTRRVVHRTTQGTLTIDLRDRARKEAGVARHLHRYGQRRQQVREAPRFGRQEGVREIPSEKEIGSPALKP